MELVLTQGNGEFGVSLMFPEVVNPPTDYYWTFASQKEAQDFARELASGAYPGFFLPSGFAEKLQAEL